jgi:hypothetical protein
MDEVLALSSLSTFDKVQDCGFSVWTLDATIRISFGRM